MKKLSFLDFCSKQFIGQQDKEEFQLWLKGEAYIDKYEFEWLRLFAEWQRLDKVPS